MNALILAAGLGTRLKPLTDRIPKALVPIADKPLLEHIILKLKAAGFNKLVVNIHHHGQQIIDFLNDNNNFGVDIKVSDERDELLDTGGAIKKASTLFDNNQPILVHNVDILSNIDLKAFYESFLIGDIDASLIVSKRDTTRYLLFNNDMNLSGWFNTITNKIRTPFEGINVNELNKLAFSGVHILSRSLVGKMQNFPDKFSVIDFYLQYCNTVLIQASLMQNLKVLDIGKIDTLAVADKFCTDNF